MINKCMDGFEGGGGIEGEKEGGTIMCAIQKITYSSFL